MKSVLRDAQNQFLDLLSILTSSETRNNDYFTRLSIATEEAYFTMNAGMCANTTVCKECSANRDFVHKMMTLLAKLEMDSSQADQYSQQLSLYAEKVKEILNRISSIMATL